MDLRLLEPGDSHTKPQGCASANAPLWGYWHGAVTGMHFPLLRGASATYRQFWTGFVWPQTHLHLGKTPEISEVFSVGAGISPGLSKSTRSLTENSRICSR